MSWLEQYRTLARYNHFMNDKLFTSAATLSDEERKRDLGAFFGSVHRTFNHILLADRAWLGRLTGQAERFASRDAKGQVIEPTSLGHELYESFEVLRRERTQTDRDLLSWVATLDEAALQTTVEYKTSNGAPQAHPMWWAVSHLFNHQTHHRGQITTLLKQLGIDPGVTDLIAHMRSERRAP